MAVSAHHQKIEAFHRDLAFEGGFGFARLDGDGGPEALETWWFVWSSANWQSQDPRTAVQKRGTVQVEKIASYCPSGKLPPKDFSEDNVNTEPRKDKDMIIRTLLTTVGALTTATIGYAALTVTAPNAAAKIETLARDIGFGWTAMSCEANPEGCLNSRFTELSRLEKEVGTSITAIRGEVDRLNTLVAEQKELVGKNTLFLDQGRAAYKVRESVLAPDGESARGIEFAGRTYPDLASFKAQLALLFQEKAVLERSLASARDLQGKLQARLDELMIQAGQITLAKRVIPAQLQLVRANHTLSEFSENLTMIDGVIEGSVAGLSQSDQLIRTTRDLMTDSTAKPASIPSQQAFEDFLKQ